VGVVGVFEKKSNDEYTVPFKPVHNDIICSFTFKMPLIIIIPLVKTTTHGLIHSIRSCCFFIHHLDRRNQNQSFRLSSFVIIIICTIIVFIDSTSSK
jgi:hypothetical protein